MTRRPGGRSTAIPAVPVLALLALVALALAACGGTTPSRPPAASGPPSGSPDGSGGGAPRPTPWLGNAVNAIEAMGLADAEIRKGMNDFNTGVQNGDPALMLQAARGLKGVDVMVENADRVEPYPPMADFARRYRTAVEQMSSSAAALETALQGGDAAGVTAASQDLVESFTLYAGVQGELAGYVVQMPEQKRMFVR